MCGIFGIISNGKSLCTKSQAHGLLKSFYKLSESRGKEAAGGAIMQGDQIDIVKESIRGRNFLGLPQTRKLANSFIDCLSEGKSFVFTGHTRMVTNGSSDVHDNNQPVIRSGLVAIHNGIIVNDAELWPDMPAVERNLEVDTEVMLALVERNLRKGFSFVAAAAEALALATATL